MSNFVDSSNTSGRPDGVYSEVIDEIRRQDVCPFCPEHLEKFHKNPIIVDGTHWLATDNMYPYENAKQHLLLIHKMHISDIDELSEEAWSELRTITQEVRQLRDMPGATLVMRFGKTALTGASVSHLHAQLVSGGGEKPVLARVG